MIILFQNHQIHVTLISAFVYSLELLFPWRKYQPKIRHDFYLDLFYMYFNFFIFNLIFFSPFSAVIKTFLMDLTHSDLRGISLFQNQNLPYLLQLILFFLVLDFVQWLTHIILHRFSFLWNFHKIHHSIKEMGFAGHLRYHWMENVIYTPVKFITVILIGGYEPANVFILYYISILIGHLNHSNLNITYGPLKYLINNPVMHLWHHAEKVPGTYRYGLNFGISLSLWDYLFKTAYIGEKTRDISIGFKHMNLLPGTWAGQMLYPLYKKD